MKKTLNLLSFAALLGISLLSVSCEQMYKDAFNEFNTKPHEVRFRVPIISTSGGDFAVYDTVQSKIDLEKEIRDNSGGTYGLGDIRAITIHSVRLTLDSADVLNSWNNFNDIEFKIISPTYNTKETIGSKHDIWEGFSSEMELDVPGVTLGADEYFRETIQYEISGKNRRPTTKELYGTAYVTFTVK